MRKKNGNASRQPEELPDCAPLVQALLIPWFKRTFRFFMHRFVSLLVFWIAMLLVLAIAHFAEGYPLRLPAQ